MRTLRGLLVAGLLLCVAVGAYPFVRELDRRSIGSVRIAGEFRHVSRSRLERLIGEAANGGFFEVDVEAVRGAAMRLPWVRDASVRRVWPDSLHVAIVERVPVAHWYAEDGADGRAHGLLETDGSLFVPVVIDAQFELPKLAGPSGSEAVVLTAYRDFSDALKPMGARIVELRMTKRGAWEIALADGMSIVLGSIVLSERRDTAALERFAFAGRAAIADRMHEVARVDLRYANGFAVQWKSVGPAIEGSYDRGNDGAED